MCFWDGFQFGSVCVRSCASPEWERVWMALAEKQNKLHGILPQFMHLAWRPWKSRHTTTFTCSEWRVSIIKKRIQIHRSKTTRTFLAFSKTKLSELRASPVRAFANMAQIFTAHFFFYLQTHFHILEINLMSVTSPHTEAAFRAGWHHTRTVQGGLACTKSAAKALAIVMSGTFSLHSKWVLLKIIKCYTARVPES